MRIAVTIIGLILMVIETMQSCTIYALQNILNNPPEINGGAAGLVVGFLFLLGSAFAIGLPWASTVLFALAALIGFGAVNAGKFPDLAVWGGVGAALAVMSLFGAVGRRREAKVKDMRPR
jgi:hypothetical protein